MNNQEEQGDCKQVYYAESCDIDTEKDEQKTAQETAQHSRCSRYQGRMQVLPALSCNPGSRLPILHFFVLPTDQNDKRQVERGKNREKVFPRDFNCERDQEFHMPLYLDSLMSFQSLTGVRL